MSAATLPEVLDPLTTHAALAVVAHPDDESFGLGAILAALADGGVDIRVLCLTHGESSTLGASDDLGATRGDELERAAEVLGVRSVTLLDFPDGGLADVPPATLDPVVDAHVGDTDLVIAFEPGGVTGHPDHRAATAAAQRVAAQRQLPVLQWGLPSQIARALNCELATAFVALDGDDIDVDRTAQWRAIACHDSQARDNHVLRRRLALQGNRERVRLAVPARDRTFVPTPGGIEGV